MSDMKFCRDCGAQIAREAEICPKCGIRQMPAPKSGTVAHNKIEGASDKSRMVALLLCIFLGGLGVHNFYAGNAKRGVLLILLWLTGFGALIIWLIDLTAILSGTFKDGDGNPILDWNI